MTGWRIGYLAAPADLIAGMVKIHQYAALCAPITSQKAAIEALARGEARRAGDGPRVRRAPPRARRTA